MDFEKVLNELLASASDMVMEFGFKLLGALVIWLVGRWLIGLAQRLLSKALDRKKLDHTLKRYVGSSLGLVLNIALIVAILGFFGVETTTFAAVLASAGVAIGMAWSGLLSNFAAGVFMIVLSPFKVGDFVTAGGVTGTVEEIGLFVTTINTPDNVRTYVGNNKIFSGDIQNFTANPYRRVDLTAQLAHGVDPRDAIARLKARLAEIPNVLDSPAPDVEVLSFTLAGPVLAVRPYTHNSSYWQVYFDTNAAIREVFAEAGYPVPEQHYHVQRPSALVA